MSTADEKYVSLTTFTKSGERKSTPVWIVAVDDYVGFTTGSDAWKLKRLRNDPRCELQACDGRGRVRDGSIVVTGKGREATAEEHAEISAAVAKKYGFANRAISAFSTIMSMVRRTGPVSNTSIVIYLD
jgi:PPOX class probable F420-dependent enzyme